MEPEEPVNQNKLEKKKKRRKRGQKNKIKVKRVQAGQVREPLLTGQTFFLFFFFLVNSFTRIFFSLLSQFLWLFLSHNSLFFYVTTWTPSISHVPSDLAARVCLLSPFILFIRFFFFFFFFFPLFFAGQQVRQRGENWLCLFRVRRAAYRLELLN